MKISFVVPSISSTVLGVVTNHARILSRNHSVQIVGPDLGGGVCPLYRDVWPYTIVQTPYLYRLPEFFSSMRRISDAIEGDVVIAVKSFAQTVLPALRQQRMHGKKIMVYLDEWDGALYQRLSLARKCEMWLKHAHHPTGEQYIPFVERSLARFDRVLCSTQWLADRFNGEVVHFGVDTDQFDSTKVDAIDDDIWRGLGLEGKRTLVFGGVVRPHKGVEDLLDAVAELQCDDVRLLIAGPQNEHVAALQNCPVRGKWLVCSGSIPKADMPRWIKRADAVALPMQESMLGKSQMPCKVFEAMAMGKAIVASYVGDLPAILDGCGLIYRTAPQLKAMLRTVLFDVASARDLGAKARKKCEAHCSADTVRQHYQELLAQLSG